jgi:hypothetical protein
MLRPDVHDYLFIAETALSHSAGVLHMTATTRGSPTSAPEMLERQLTQGKIRVRVTPAAAPTRCRCRRW